MRKRFSIQPVECASLVPPTMIEEEELEPMLGIRSERSVNIKDVKLKRASGVPCVYLLLFLIALLVSLTLLLVMVVLAATVRMKAELVNTRDSAFQQITDSLQNFRDSLEEFVKKIPFWSEEEPILRRLHADGKWPRMPQYGGPEVLKGEVHNVERSNLQNRSKGFDPLCSRSCSNPLYERHPLLVISLDGFAHEYIERNIVKTLDRFKKCGTAAKWMYASYPSKTFPNHYTMATGLYPESHGIIDNEVNDPALTDDLVDVRRTSDPRYFKGEPIWATAAKYNMTTACLFWAGCSVDFNGVKPTYNLPYDPAMDFRARIDKLMEWLALPENLRPSLLMAYFNQPDYAGHFQLRDEQVNEVLKDLNVALDRLLDLLSQHNILGCLNIIIVSDHGMHKLDRRFYLDQLLNTKDMIVSSSVVARIRMANSTMSKDDVLDHFRCKDHGAIFRIYDNGHIPKRYHYEASNRIGDFVIEGQPGTTFYATVKKDVGVTADHGYDYIIPQMRTVFFAAGPAILPEKYIEPFQNIEIYNLIADLIGISKRALNNGTYGRLHEVLVNPPVVDVASRTNVVKECSPNARFLAPKAVVCDYGCQKDEEALTASLSSCLHDTPKGHLGYFNVDLPYCYLSLCATTAIVAPSQKNAHPRALYEVLTDVELEKQEANREASYCTFIHSQFDVDCSLWNTEKNESTTENQLTFTSLFTNQASRPLETLRRTVLGYAKHYKRLIVISGAVNDFDHDGLADDVETTAERIKKDDITAKLPTHIFAVLIRCADLRWADDGHSCEDAAQTRVLSFLLPNRPDDLNCLHPEEYLRVNTARVRDIELLTGLEFFTSRSHYPQNIALQLRTHIPDKLWFAL